MKLLHSTLLFTIGVSSSVLERAACNADNCARALTGRMYSGLRVATDCSAFQTHTICPAPTTVTSTTGSSSTIVTGAACVITRVPTLPAYAEAACLGNPSSRFASACACAGSTATTVTAAQQTITIVKPTTTPSTSCDTAPDGAFCSSMITPQSAGRPVKRFRAYRGRSLYGYFYNRFPGDPITDQECVDNCANALFPCVAVNLRPLESGLAYCCYIGLQAGETTIEGPFDIDIPGVRSFLMEGVGLRAT